MRTRRLIGCLPVVALLASCGGNGSKTAAPTTNGAAPSTTATAGGPPSSALATTTTAALDPAQAAKAKTAVLQAADIPAGYQEEAPEDSFDQETTFQDLSTCLGVATRGQGSATSATYGKPPATKFVSTVEYFASPSVQSRVQSIAAGFAPGPKFDKCALEAFTADLKRNAPQGSTVSTVEVTPLDFPKLGQATSASHVMTILSIPNGPTIPISQDVIVVFKGDAISRLTFLSPGQPFPPDIERTLVGTVVDRT